MGRSIAFRVGKSRPLHLDPVLAILGGARAGFLTSMICSASTLASLFAPSPSQVDGGQLQRKTVATNALMPPDDLLGAARGLGVRVKFFTLMNALPPRRVTSQLQGARARGGTAFVVVVPEHAPGVVGVEGVARSRPSWRAGHACRSAGASRPFAL